MRLFKKIRPDSIRELMKNVLKNPQSLTIPRWALKDSHSFRIMASQENQTVTIDKDTLYRMESFFSHKLNMPVHRSKPDVEVWFLERREGYGFAGIRLTHSSTNEKNLQKGELRPEIANILCLISEPRKDEIFLDAFAGSGAIPIERTKIQRFKQIIASDHDDETVKALQKRINKTGLKITCHEADALNLEQITNKTVDRIVTDPPWGMYEFQDSLTLDKLYSGMLAEFNRILKDDGIIVVLMGQKEIFEAALKRVPLLQTVKKYNILVSGKKAAIYKIKKK